jgi:hypothetical protein
MKKLIISVITMLFVFCGLSFAESKYATGSTSAALTFGPGGGKSDVVYLTAKSDKAASLIKIYEIGGAERVGVTTAPTNGATQISVSSITGFATNDIVVYVHSDGTVLKSTVSGIAAGKITMAAGISKAGTTSDYLYEVTQAFQIACGATQLNLSGSPIFTSRAASPVYIVVDGTSACQVAATVTK